MTRFARAKGSKASNEKTPDDGTPWEVMKQQLLESKNQNEHAKKREEVEQQRIENYQNFLKEQKVQKRKATWCDFPESEQNKKKKKQKSKPIANNNNAEKSKPVPDEQVILNNVQGKLDSNLGDQSPKKKKNKKLTSQHVGDAPTKDPNPKDNPLPTCDDSSKEPKNKKKNKNKNKKLAGNNTGNAANNDPSPIENPLLNGDESSKEQKKKKKNKKTKVVTDAEGDVSTNNNAAKLNTDQPNNKAQQNNKEKKKKKRFDDNSQASRRKPLNDNSFQLIINGKEVDLVRFEGFPIMKKDADRLSELKGNMMKKGIPKSEVQRTIKLERRRAEKALARLKRDVCYNCRKGGHNLSDCPELKSKIPGVDAGDGMCFKCGSTEHRQFECKVQRDKEFRFATCFICKDQGHIARQCPDNPKGLYPNGGACKLCGDVTHLRKDCPTVKDQKEETSIKLATLNDEEIEGIAQQKKEASAEEKPKKPKKIKF